MTPQSPIHLMPRTLIYSLSAIVLFITTRSLAEDPPKPSPAAPLMKLLQSGKLPKERIGMVLEMICNKGTSDDLEYIFQQAVQPDAWSQETRVKALDLLADAAANHKLPSGDLSVLGNLVSDAADHALQLKAIRLAGSWKLKGAAASIEQLALSSSADDLQSAAIESLASIGGPESKATLERISAQAKPQALRYHAISALAHIDLRAAAEAAAITFAEATTRDDPSIILDEFLNRKQGADVLAAALRNLKLDRDAARRALRHMMSLGHSDPSLSDVLSKAADVPTNPPLPTEDEVKSLAEEVAKKGNGARGEDIFRRADLNCLRCHSVAKAGGEVGPDLSSVGKSSPLDYIVRSILNPSAQIKEEFDTRIIVTDAGMQYMGIVKNRNNNQILLKDAAGKLIAIPVAEIEQERAGKSLMPEGVTKFLTHQEFLDLAKFVGELGKPGPFEMRTTPTIQRWRILRGPADSNLGEIPNVDMFRDQVLGRGPDNWAAVYAKVSGELPLADAAELTTGAKGNSKSQKPIVVYLQGDVNVIEPGDIGFRIQAPPGTFAWIDAEPFEPEALKEIAINLVPDDTGSEHKPHKLTLRVPTASSNVRVELFRPIGSAAQFQPVGGP